jgi:DNA-binding CsgD family transcriptional regulator
MMADLLDSRSLQQDMLSAAFDLLTTAVVLVDSGMRIVHDNTAAKQLMAQGTVLRRVGDRLSTRDPNAVVGIKDAVDLITKGDTVLATRAGVAVVIEDQSGKEFAVWVLPLDSGSRREMAAPFEAKAAIFARELGDTSAFPGELFVKRYGITPGECRVLMMLVQGLSVAETCDALGIGEPTVKTHLSRLFAKTGTSGQPDLMRVAVSALAPAQRQAPST